MSTHVALSIQWPHEVTTEQVRAALLALHGLSTPRRRDAFVFVVRGDAAGIHHYLFVPAERRLAAITALRHAIPGIGVEEQADALPTDVQWWRVWLSSRTRPLRTKDAPTIANGLLSALTGLHGTETVMLAWVVGPVRRPIAVPVKTPADRSGSPLAVLAGVWAGAADLDSEARTALLHKQGEPGWRAAGQLALRAASRERRLQLLGRLTAALRVSQGPGVQLGVHRAWLTPSLLPWRRPLAVNVEEMLALAAWPVEVSDLLPLDRIASRLLPVPRAVPRRGRVLGVAAYPGDERAVAMSVRDSATHLAITGPTNVGKSTVLVHLAAQDIAAGRAVVFLDPKGDGVTTLLSYIPEYRRDDVVVLDLASDDGSVIGFNPLVGSRRNPDLVADQLLHLFRSLSGEAWGPRISETLAAALTTCAHQPDASLCLVPFLLTDRGVRRRAMAHVKDPFGLEPFWASFDALSPAEREQVVAPVMRRLRALLLNPRLRVVLGQAKPRFTVQQVLTERKILLVSLAAGTVGPVASSLIGSVVLATLWQAILGRAALPPEQRHPVMTFVDEVQHYVHGITDLGEMFALARSHGAPLHVAHQHLAQISRTDLRSALDANARSRLVFQCSAEDAGSFARGQRTLRPEDFQRLPRFHAYARLAVEGAVTPYFSVKTLPLPEPISDPATIRAISRERYGVPREQVEAELQALLGGTGTTPDAPLGQRRRPS